LNHSKWEKWSGFDEALQGVAGSQDRDAEENYSKKSVQEIFKLIDEICWDKRLVVCEQSLNRLIFHNYHPC
jgi:hypothetical protein